MVASLLTRIVQPHISGPYGLDRHFLRKLWLFLGCAFGALWAGCAVTAWAVVTFMLPAAYGPALPLTFVLMAAATLFATATVLSAYLVRLNEERFVWLASVVACSVFLISLATRPGESIVIALLTVLAACCLVVLLGVRFVARLQAGFGSNLVPAAFAAGEAPP